jgi:hypothetical protein
VDKILDFEEADAMTLTGNATLSAATNVVPGQSGVIAIILSGTS